MGVIEDCRFETERLRITPWTEETSDGLTDFVVELLSPAATGALPPDWAGSYDHERAQRWIRDREAESTILLARERATGAPTGLLLVATDVPDGCDLRIGYLLPDRWWGRGFGSELVGGFLAWCRSDGHVRSVAAGVDPGNTASARILAELGFASDGIADAGQETYHLSVRPEPTVRIRPENSADVASIRRVVTAAFGSPVEAALVDRIRVSPEYLPELALVAETDGVVVGHVMISGAVLRGNGDHERPIVMLSPLAVEPDHQRRGLGEALVRAAVDGADRRGEPLVVVEGSPAYYSRFGFEHSVTHGLTLPLPDWAPSEAGQVICLTTYDGADPTLRGHVVYPAAFDGLDD